MADLKKKWNKEQRKIRCRGGGEDYQCLSNDNDPEVSLYRIYTMLYMPVDFLKKLQISILPEF